MDPNTPYEVGQLHSSTLHWALTRWNGGELHCQNVCRLSKQVLMNMTVCAMGSLSVSVNMQPCSSDSCLPRWVAITWGLEVNSADIFMHRWLWWAELAIGHIHQCGVFSRHPFLDVQSVLADLSPEVMQSDVWAPEVSSLRKQNVLSNLSPTSSGVFDGENGYSYWFSFWGNVSIIWGGQWGRCRGIVRCVPGSSDLG